IGELVLHGVEPGDRERLAADIERELARLLEEGGLPAALAAGGTVHLDGAALALPAGSPPEELGAAIAREAHGRIRARGSAEAAPPIEPIAPTAPLAPMTPLAPNTAPDAGTFPGRTP